MAEGENRVPSELNKPAQAREGLVVGGVRARAHSLFCFSPSPRMAGKGAVAEKDPMVALRLGLGLGSGRTRQEGDGDSRAGVD